jgi:hypothetical protein
MARDPDTQHPRVFGPVQDQILVAAERDAAHRGESVRMRVHGGKHDVVAFSFPRRRNKHGTVDTRGIHLAEQLWSCQPMVTGRGGVRWPWTAGTILVPKVNLRVDDHGLIILCEQLSLSPIVDELADPSQSVIDPEPM